MHVPRRLGLGVAERDRGEGHDRTRDLGAHRHVRAAVLHGLKGADRPTELVACLGVRDRAFQRPLGDPERLGSNQHHGRAPERDRVGGEQLRGSILEGHVRQPPRRIEALAGRNVDTARARRNAADALPAEHEEDIGGSPVGDALCSAGETTPLPDRIHGVVYHRDAPGTGDDVRELVSQRRDTDECVRREHRAQPGPRGE